jgi:hypothetical protein
MMLSAAIVGWTGCGAPEEDASVDGQTNDLRDRPGDGRNRACGARLGDTCREGEFCDWTLEGICGFADATGICKPIPQGCTFQYDPVCGCDGYTYGNACAANGAGVSVLHPGECEGDVEEDAGVDPGPESDAACGTPSRQCGGIAGLPCDEGQFCNLEPTAGGLGCDVADATGVCQPIPELCTREYAPVCGCDGNTYGNACTAHGSGVSVAHPGECEGLPEPGEGERCGGLTGLACSKGEFCNFEGDPSGVACGAADGTGICQPIPEACTLQYDPVCGCDDQTYGNACAAHAAGVSVATHGACAQGAVSCDPRAIRCRRLPPECPFGQVPAIEGTCYGDCVPVEQCACREAAACPQPEEYTCHLSAGHCGPYVN